MHFFLENGTKVAKKLWFWRHFHKHFRTFAPFPAITKKEKRERGRGEGTLDVIILRQIVMGFLEPLNVSLGFQSTKNIENHWLEKRRVTASSYDRKEKKAFLRFVLKHFFFIIFSLCSFSSRFIWVCFDFQITTCAVFDVEYKSDERCSCNTNDDNSCSSEFPCYDVFVSVSDGKFAKPYIIPIEIDAIKRVNLCPVFPVSKVLDGYGPEPVNETGSFC